LTVEKALSLASLNSFFTGINMSYATRQLISNIGTLRALGMALMQDHAILFWQSVETIVISERALHNERKLSMWLCMDEADAIVKVRQLMEWLPE
jgi:O-acetylhomoserine/O-acetylserine sulfhydrylase-like pyridoxal-dependent enzyme